MKTLGFMVFMLGVSSMIHAYERNKCRRDLGLVVDATRSIKKRNIPLLKYALKHLLERFYIAKGETHVSYQTFHKKAKIHIKFKDAANHNKSTILDRIDRTTMRLRQPTRLDRGMEAANRKMFTSMYGMRSGIPKAVVLYTDGKTHPRTAHADLFLDVLALKEKGVRVIVVAIGPFAKLEKHRDLLTDIGHNFTHWVEDYASLDNHTQQIYDLICPPNPCKEGVDLAVVLDRTRSISLPDFIGARGFVKELIQSLVIGPNATHLGLILFARNARVFSTFADGRYHSNAAAVGLIDSIPNKRFMPTRTDRALEAACHQLFIEEKGDRPTKPNVLVLLTDGKTHPNSRAFSEIVPCLKDKGVHIAVVGIGSHESFAGQLEEIADPKNVHTVLNIDELADIVDRIVEESCSVDGGLSNWTDWGPCSAMCDGGQRSRSRECNTPIPSYPYGVNCEGHRIETEACNTNPCRAQPYTQPTGYHREPEILIG